MIPKHADPKSITIQSANTRVSPLEVLAELEQRANREIQSAKTGDGQPVPETARVENTLAGQCPLCKTPMRQAVANGIQVHTCLEDAIVLPIRDSNHAEQ